MPAQGAAPNVMTPQLLDANGVIVVQLTLSPVSVAAATTVEQTFTLTGLSLGDALQGADRILSVSKPTLQAGLAFGGARVSAANTVAVTFINATAATAIVPTEAEVYSFVVYRPYSTVRTSATVV
jgi:hypothetical protein